MFENKNCLIFYLKLKLLTKFMGMEYRRKGWGGVGWGGEAKEEGRGRGENKVTITQ